jgi:hypothetical protein
MRNLKTRPIRSVLARRRMFANGGMMAPNIAPQQGPAGILASSQPLMQAAGRSFVDSMAQDAVNPMGGGTLAMAEGGVARFQDGGQYLMGMKPVQLQVPMDAPVTRETYGLAPIHEGQSFGQSAGSIDYSKIMVPSITPRIGRKGLEIGAPPIEISAEQLKTESPRQKYDRMAPATLSSPWSVEFYEFDKANPKFEAAKRAQAAKTGKAYSRAEVAGAKAWAMLHGGLGVLSSGAADVLNTAHDWFFGRGNPTEKTFMQIMVLDEFKQRRPDLAKDIDAMGKIILGNAPDISGAKLEETIANALSNKYELGHQIAAEDIALEDIDRGVTPLDQRQRQQLTEAGVPDDMVEDVLLYMNQNWEANPTIEDATAFVRGTREEVVAEADRAASAEAAKEFASWDPGELLKEQPGYREFGETVTTPDISGAGSLPPVTTENQASPEWMGPKPEVPEGTRSTVDGTSGETQTAVDGTSGETSPEWVGPKPDVSAIFDKSDMPAKEATRGMQFFIDRFKDAAKSSAPYQGMSEEEKGWAIFEAGLRVMAGQSPDAITNIAEGMKGLSKEFAADEKEKRLYDRQIGLSAAKYALDSVTADETREFEKAKAGRALHTVIAIEDVFHPDGTLRAKKGQGFWITRDEMDGGDYDGKVEPSAIGIKKLEANAEKVANLAKRSLRLVVGQTRAGGMSDAQLTEKTNAYRDAAVKTADLATQLALLEMSTDINEAGGVTGIRPWTARKINSFYNIFGLKTDGTLRITKLTDITDKDLENANVSKERKDRIKLIQRQSKQLSEMYKPSFFDRYAKEGRESKRFFQHQQELANLLIKEILGEGSKNVSNIDRQLAQEIVGLFTDAGMITADPELIAGRLDRIRQRIINNYGAELGTMEGIQTELKDLVERDMKTPVVGRLTRHRETALRGVAEGLKPLMREVPAGGRMSSLLKSAQAGKNIYVKQTQEDGSVRYIFRN